MLAYRRTKENDSTDLSGIRKAFYETPTFKGNSYVLTIKLLSNVNPLEGDYSAR